MLRRAAPCADSRGGTSLRTSSREGGAQPVAADEAAGHQRTSLRTNDGEHNPPSRTMPQDGRRVKWQLTLRRHSN